MKLYINSVFEKFLKFFHILVVVVMIRSIRKRKLIIKTTYKTHLNLFFFDEGFACFKVDIHNHVIKIQRQKLQITSSTVFRQIFSYRLRFFRIQIQFTFKMTLFPMFTALQANFAASCSLTASLRSAGTRAVIAALLSWSKAGG